MITEIFRMLRRRLAVGAVLAVLAFGVAACGHTGQVREIVLLNTNDSHGSILPVDSIGGMAERATFIQEVRKQNPYVLLVDAGDINAGQPVSNMADALPDIVAYNYMKYDAATAGNHEFDKPVKVLLKQIQEADFPFVISNVEMDGKLLGEEYLVKRVDGIKVGLFGLTTSYTANLSVGAQDLVFKNEVETARRMVKLLKEKKVDVIIGLVHLGFTETTPDFITSRKLAAQVDGIDILVDGHSHSYIEKPEKVNDTWIITANQSGRYVGEGKLTVKDGKLIDFSWKPVLIKGFAPDTVLNRLLEPFVEEANRDLKTVIGVATEEFILFKNGQNVARYNETALGDLVADALKWKATESLNLPVDFGLTNSGGIREGLPAGEITKENILTTLPFSNVLEIVALKGSDIRRLFDFLATVTPGNGAFAQVSKEVKVVYDRGNKKVVSLSINDKPIVDTVTYYMATCDYVAAGKDGYDAGLGGITQRENTSRLISEVVVDYIKMKDKITPKTDGRIKIIK